MDNFDLIIVGSGLSGILTGCDVASQGARCLWIPHPGPWRDVIQFPVFKTQDGDIWHQWFDLNHIEIPSSCTLGQEGDPALVYLSENQTLTFQHTATPRELLMAHNACLPDAFFEFFETLYHLMLKNEAYLRHRLLHTLTKSKTPAALHSVLRERYIELRAHFKHVSVPQGWEWQSFIHALAPLVSVSPLPSDVLWMSNLYPLFMPKSRQWPLGTVSLTACLTQHFRSRGGEVYANIPISEIFIDHREVKGVVLNHPRGIVRGKCILLNTGMENLTHAIPKPFVPAFNFLHSERRPVNFYLQVEKLIPLSWDSAFEPALFYPIVGAETDEIMRAHENNFYVFASSDGTPYAKCAAGHTSVLKNRASLTPADTYTLVASPFSKKMGAQSPHPESSSPHPESSYRHPECTSRHPERSEGSRHDTTGSFALRAQDDGRYTQDDGEPAFQNTSFQNTICLPRHGVTAYNNVRYVSTFPCVSMGPIGALTEALWTSRWVMDQLSSVSTGYTRPRRDRCLASTL